MRIDKSVYFKKFVCLMLLSTIIWSCSRTALSRADSAVAILLPFSDINDTIVLSFYPYCPGTKLAINYEFCILLENRSREVVKFSTDLGIKLYLHDESEDQWVEVQNKMNYHGDEIVLSPKEDGEWNYLEIVWPELPALDTPAMVRILVIGHTTRNGEEEPVGAYLDVTLEP